MRDIVCHAPHARDSKYKKDIGKLPELRRDFHRMCAQIGVDPLACLTPAT